MCMGSPEESNENLWDNGAKEEEDGVEAMGEEGGEEEELDEAERGSRTEAGAECKSTLRRGERPPTVEPSWSRNPGAEWTLVA